MIAIFTFTPMPFFSCININNFYFCRASSQSYTMICFVIDFGLWSIADVYSTSVVTTEQTYDNKY